MRTLSEILEFAIKNKACRGNREAFSKALAEGNELECYQILLGNHVWLLNYDIIKDCDLPELMKLARGTGKSYHFNESLSSTHEYEWEFYFKKQSKKSTNSHANLHKHYRVGKFYYPNGMLQFVVNYKNGKQHGVYEEWSMGGQLTLRAYYENDKLDGLYEEFDSEGRLKKKTIYENGEIIP